MSLRGHIDDQLSKGDFCEQHTLKVGLRTVHNCPYTIRSTLLTALVHTITAVMVVYTAVLVLAGYNTITSLNKVLNAYRTAWHTV